MTDQSTRPEVDDPRVLALAKARQRIAYSSPFNFVCPPWDGLTKQEQETSLLEARNWLHAAMGAGLAADRGTVLREAIDVAREEGHRLEAEQGIETARGARSVAYLLRKLLAKAQPAVRTGQSEAEAAATHARDCLDRPAIIRWCADRVRSTDGDYAIQAAAEYLDDLATEAEGSA